MQIDKSVRRKKVPTSQQPASLRLPWFHLPSFYQPSPHESKSQQAKLIMCIFASNDGLSVCQNYRKTPGYVTYRDIIALPKNIYIATDCRFLDLTSEEDTTFCVNISKWLKNDVRHRINSGHAQSPNPSNKNPILVISVKKRVFNSFMKQLPNTLFYTVSRSSILKNISNEKIFGEIAGPLDESLLIAKTRDDHLRLEWCEYLNVDNKTGHQYFVPSEARVRLCMDSYTPSQPLFPRVFPCYSSHQSTDFLTLTKKFNDEACRWIQKETEYPDYDREIDRKEQLQHLPGFLKYAILKVYNKSEACLRYVLMITPARYLKYKIGDCNKVDSSTLEVISVGLMFHDVYSRYIIILDDLENNNRVSMGTYMALQLTSDLRRCYYIGVLKKHVD
ncbi:hypothetical protein CHUAL_005161 [Chamberlinius hualienensis]